MMEAPKEDTRVPREGGDTVSAQLEAIELPQELWEVRFEVSIWWFHSDPEQRALAKLAGEVFDAGEAVEFAYDDDTITGIEYKVVAKKDIAARSDVWLVDHAWYHILPSSLLLS